GVAADTLDSLLLTYGGAGDVSESAAGRARALDRGVGPGHPRLVAIPRSARAGGLRSAARSPVHQGIYPRVLPGPPGRRRRSAVSICRPREAPGRASGPRGAGRLADRRPAALPRDAAAELRAARRVRGRAVRRRAAAAAGAAGTVRAAGCARSTRRGGD